MKNILQILVTLLIATPFIYMFYDILRGIYRDLESYISKQKHPVYIPVEKERNRSRR
ncbi:MAG: hypothetical protein GF313_00960 [Caldithrix sp.]|nr:hypothetical protein [Caldithrix sp.]